MWDLIVSVPDHCLSFYFLFSSYTKGNLAKSIYPYISCFRTRCLIIVYTVCLETHKVFFFTMIMQKKGYSINDI